VGKTMNAGYGGAALRGGRKAGGFTLVELMVTLLVVAILLGIAVPSFRDAALSSRLTGYANDLVASVQLARSEAIKRNLTVTLCASVNGSTCAAGVGWEVGWIVLAPRPTAIATLDVVDHHAPLTEEFIIEEAAGLTELTFPPTVVGPTQATFTVCREEPVGKQEREVTVTVSGATSVETTENGECPPA
jgi:type IV fimbrial biogenesis protein FimT